jgi:hypothetical protein
MNSKKLLILFAVLALQSCGDRPPAISETGSIPDAPLVETVDPNAAVAAGFRFEVQDSEQLNQLAAVGGERVIQKGIATDVNAIADRSLNLCFIERVAGAGALLPAEKLRFTRITDQGRRLMIVNEKLSIGCLRLSGASGNWTVTDLQEVFGDLAKVVPTPVK